ncbi:hypothetical protein [Runella sp.]|uniref:hypothetical protein n=1 Tax=Runella sp. TaxID=1960881 RepID=UPI003D0BCE48
MKANTFVPTSAQAGVYTATCLSTGCQAFIFFAPPPAYLPCKAFVAKATPALVYARKSTSITFEASGCEAGTVQWSNGKTGFSFTENLSLKEDLTYVAECIIDGEKVPTSVTVKILRNSSGEPLDPACSNFTAFAKPINSALSAPYPAGTEFVLTAQNCPGKVTWDPSLGQGNKVSPDITSYYTATCYNAAQSVCASQNVKIEIQQDLCETYGTRTDKTVRSLTHLTNVVGINGQTCPGKVIWYSREERTQNSIICELSPANPAYALAEPLVYKGETLSYSYFYDCWVDAGRVCRGDVNYIISNSGQIGGGGRVSAYNSSCLPASLPLAMTDYLAKLLCDSKPQWQGSAERAQAFYAALQQAITADPTLGSYQPDFSKADQNALLTALRAADCQAAGQELSKAFSGSISVDAFNQNVRGGYSKVLESLLIFKGQFIVYTRHFIPETRDGFYAYRGDGRGFSNVPNDVLEEAYVEDGDWKTNSARVIIRNLIHFERKKIEVSRPYCDFTELLAFIRKAADPEVISKRLSFTNNLSYCNLSYTASDPLALGLAPVLNYDLTIQVAYLASIQTIKVTTSLVGDPYPAGEIFIVDQQSKQSWFLDTYSIPKEMEIIASYPENHLPLINNVTYFKVDASGRIRSAVDKLGQPVALTVWNSFFQNRNPRK